MIMFAIVKTEGGYVAKETPHYSKLESDIDVQLSQNQPVILVLALEDVAAIGIDPASVTMDGEPTMKKEPAPEEPVK